MGKGREIISHKAEGEKFRVSFLRLVKVIRGSCRFVVFLVQSVHVHPVSADIAASEKRTRGDLGLSARGEGGELSNKDGDKRANPLQRWFRDPIQPARLRVRVVGRHFARERWLGDCIIFSREMQIWDMDGGGREPAELMRLDCFAALRIVPSVFAGLVVGRRIIPAPAPGQTR